MNLSALRALRNEAANYAANNASNFASLSRTARLAIPDLTEALEVLEKLEALQQSWRAIEKGRWNSEQAHVRGWAEGHQHCADGLAELIGTIKP